MIKADRHYPIEIQVVDSQYVYMELPFDVMPFSTVYRPFYYNICVTEGDTKDYVGYTYGARHFNRTCTAHFDKIEWQKKVAEILATMETTSPEPELTTEPAETRRRFWNFFGLPKN